LLKTFILTRTVLPAGQVTVLAFGGENSDLVF
jgi:hypothetical protein